MKLLVKKLWYPYSVDAVLSALFKIPQIPELFDEGYVYDGEMRPRRIMICSGYWPVDRIFERLPNPDNNVYLVLTSMDLKGDGHRVNGKGRDRKAIASCDSYRAGIRKEIFDPENVDFNAMAFEEVSHALGAEHHAFDSRNPCVMSGNETPGPNWNSLEDIRLCENCYQQLRT